MPSDKSDGDSCSCGGCFGCLATLALAVGFVWALNHVPGMMDALKTVMSWLVGVPLAVITILVVGICILAFRDKAAAWIEYWRLFHDFPERKELQKARKQAKLAYKAWEKVQGTGNRELVDAAQHANRVTHQRLLELLNLEQRHRTQKRRTEAARVGRDIKQDITKAAERPPVELLPPEDD